MKKFLLLIVFFFLSIIISTAFSDKKAGSGQLFNLPSPEDYILNNSTLGRDFWVAIPQNETTNGNLKAVGVEIVVTSPYKTAVTLEIPEVGYTRTKTVEPFQAISFSSSSSDISFAQEVTESETITKKGLHLFGDKPFAVHVVNSKEYSAESYQAIPTSRWGIEHYHCAYYDFYDESKARGGGFIIVASENATNVQIKLNGIGPLVGQTVMGKKIGETFSVTLNAGDTYMVRGEGKTRGEFDISGSYITSNKPIGVISFHMRTMIPSICPEDRDNLMEMLPSVNHWGKTFATIQFDRKTSGDRQGKGDLFRLMASEDATSYSCDFYDIASYLKEGTRSFTLNKSSMFSEIDAITDINNSNKKTSVFGMSYWTSNKPAMLLQNAFSNRWDGDNKWSPLNVYIAPVEQYVRSAIFTTPQTTGFQEHQMTIIAIGDPNDPNSNAIRSISINGKELWRTDPRILQNRIPNTNLWWARIPMQTGTYYITSQTKFFAYMVGFDAMNAYGHPVAQNFDNLNELDTVAPNYTKIMTCGNYACEATETTIGKTGDNPKQIDQGLSEIVLFENLSNNYLMTIDNPSAFKPQLKIVKQKFTITLIDDEKPGKAVFAIMDRAGNIRIDSVTYDPPNVGVTPKSTDFGKVRLHNSIDKSVVLKNSSKETYKVNSITNKNPKFVLSNFPALPYTLQSGDSIIVNVKYTPVLQSPSATDIDTIFFKSDCMNIETGFTGKVIYPTVTVTPEYNLGKVKKGVKVCLEEINQKGLKVKNNGSDTLKIYYFSEVEAPFLVSKPTEPSLPLALKSGDSVYFKSFCFVPQDSGMFQTTVTVLTDAIQGDSIITLKGEGWIEVVPSVSWDQQSGLWMSVSPNPAHETVSIDWKSNNQALTIVDLIDLTGTTVRSTRFDNSSEGRIDINTMDLHAGLYTIRLLNAGNIIMQKVIILK